MIYQKQKLIHCLNCNKKLTITYYYVKIYIGDKGGILLWQKLLLVNWV